MNTLFHSLSLTDLISLKQHLMSVENRHKLCSEPAEKILEVSNRLVMVEKEINERIERIFA